MCLLVNYITQFKPLENGNCEGVLKRPCQISTKCLDFKHEFLKFAGKYRAKNGYVLAFQLYHRNQTLGIVSYKQNPE